MELGSAGKAIFDTMREGILVIDTDAKIVYGNAAYLAFLGMSLDEILGVPLRTLRPGSRLPEVLVTGQPILHAPRQEVEDIYFVNMYPIYEDGRLVGGVSVVTFQQDAFDFRAKLEEYAKRNKQLFHRVNKANSTRYTFDSIVAVSGGMHQVKELAQKAARTDAAIMLASESGTGKELFAQAIHNASNRKNEIFVAINCANFNAAPWSPSCSAMWRAPSPAQKRAVRWACSRQPTAAPSFSTRCRKWTSAFRQSCCAPFRRAASGRLAA